MEDPPLTLSFLGHASWREEKNLSVVGSREPCFESTQWMEKEFSEFCEKSKTSIISGGARGIDQKAHAIALRHHLSTVVVLPSGLASMYPDSLREWVSPILDKGGCFLSEYSYEQKMHKHLFHHRNRLIAALGKATLLIEARRRSGTLITAHQALQLGRPVWVVPGHPLDVHFGGSLDLLTEGAALVRDAEDLFMYFKSELAPVNVQMEFNL
jgi:DNA processing protein